MAIRWKNLSGRGPTILLFGALLALPALSASAQDDDEDFLDTLLDAPAQQQDEESDQPQQTIELEERTQRGRSGARRPGLEEIVVTAQKREQTLADVPLSVTAVGGDKLRDAGIENISDLSEYTPNFKLVDGGLIPNVYMRGVGSGSNQGFELSVGIFADGIHLGRPHQTRAAFMDVERIEVLRGPQSILFGKNAIAGALNIISARPGDSFEGRLNASYDVLNDDSEFGAMVSGPVGERLGARLALRHRDQNGYLFNELQQRTEPGVDEQAGRLTLDWQAADWLDTSLKLERTRREQTGRTFQTTHAGAITRCTGEDIRLDRRKVTDAREIARIDGYNTTLTLAAPLAGGELTAVSGWSGFDSNDLFDADSSSIDTLALLGVETYDQFSQEIRFASAIGDKLDWIAGAFYQGGDLDFYEFGPTKARGGALADSSCEANQQVLAAADLERDFTIDSAAWSVFGQLSWAHSAVLRSTLGLRYVQENKDGYRRFFIFEPGTRQQANPVTLAALDQLLINEHELAGTRDVGVLLPSVNLQYDITPGSMTYASYTRGAKSGSFDARNNNGNTDEQGGATRFEFEDETADAYELGAKMRLADGAAELNLALYHVDYQDMQVSVYDGVAGFTVTNAGSARTRGVELDGRWLLTESLRLNASVAYLDFEWLDYEDGPCHANSENEDPDTGTCDMTGKVNLQTPEWTASLSASFVRPILRGLQMLATLDASFRDSHFTSGDLDPRGRQAAVTRFNGRLGIAPPDQRWSLALVGKNLGDELTLGIGAPTALDVGGYRATVEPERSLALEATARF